MESVRTVNVTVEVDTNKATYKETFEVSEDDALEDVIEAAHAWARDVLDGINDR